jgi:hypothetical protein
VPGSGSKPANGRWRTPSTARLEQADLLADRLRGHGHTFLKAVHTADGALVGWAWVAPGPAFLALLTPLHDQLAAKGAQALYVHVYDWNMAARRLYARCGIEVVCQFATDVHLRKHLATIDR